MLFGLKMAGLFDQRLASSVKGLALYGKHAFWAENDWPLLSKRLALFSLESMHLQTVSLFRERASPLQEHAFWIEKG